MKMSDLETKLADRANASVQEKIVTFKREIDAALTKLFGNGHAMGVESFGKYLRCAEGTKPRNKAYAIALAKLEALKLAICEKDDADAPLPWPSMLWDRELEEMRTELLSKMDLMQKLLMTPQRSTTDDVPHE